MDKGRTQTNEQKAKEIDDYAQGLTLKRWHRLYILRKEGGGGLISIEDCMYTSIQGLKKYTKKSKERLITAASNRNGNIGTSKKQQKN